MHLICLIGGPRLYRVASLGSPQLTETSTFKCDTASGEDPSSGFLSCGFRAMWPSRFLSAWELCSCGGAQGLLPLPGWCLSGWAYLCYMPPCVLPISRWETSIHQFHQAHASSLSNPYLSCRCVIYYIRRDSQRQRRSSERGGGGTSRAFKGMTIYSEAGFWPWQGDSEDAITLGGSFLFLILSIS